MIINETSRRLLVIQEDETTEEWCQCLQRALGKEWEVCFLQKETLTVGSLKGEANNGKWDNQDVVLVNVSLGLTKVKDSVSQLKTVRDLRLEGFQGGIVFLKFDEDRWLLSLNDQMDGQIDGYLGKMAGVLRCACGAQGEIKIPFELEDLRSVLNAVTSKPVDLGCCLATCGSWREEREEAKQDPPSAFTWRYMIIDDLICGSHCAVSDGPGNNLNPIGCLLCRADCAVPVEREVQREWFLPNSEGNQFFDLVNRVRKEFPGTLLLRDTRFLCDILKNQKEARREIKEEETRVEKLDFIFLDIIFDQQVSMDIKIIPCIRSFSSVPIFMLTSASHLGHAARTGISYYPVRALRLGAQGYFDKGELVDSSRILDARRQIMDHLAHRDWEREYHERFAGECGVLLTGNMDLLAQCYKDIKDDAVRKETKKHYEYLIKKLFDRCSEVTLLDSPSHGVSSAHTLFVRPKARGVEQNVKLVKIGPTCDLLFEKQNFDDNVEGYVDTFIGRVDHERVATDQYSGIVYSTVGYKDEYEKGLQHYPQTLHKLFWNYIHKPSGGKKMREALGKIFDRILLGLYADRDRKTVPALTKYYSILPPFASFKLEPGQPMWDKKVVVDEISLSSLTSLEGPVLLCGQVSRWKEGAEVPSIEISGPKSFKQVNIAGQAVWGFLRDPRLRYGKEIEIPGSYTENMVERLQRMVSELVSPLQPERCQRWTRYQELLKDGVDLDYLPDPLCLLKRILDTQPSPPLKMTIGTAHGDLNLGNILVSDLEQEDRVRDFWLIDFASTQREQHVAFDLAKLETEIKTHLLSRVLMEYWLAQEMQAHRRRGEVCQNILFTSQNFEEALTCYSLNGGMQEDIGKGKWWSYTPLSNLFQAICFIRRKALDLGITADEYFLSLFFYSLKALGFANLGNPQEHSAAPFPKIVAYIAASVASVRVANDLTLSETSKA